jgi:hypothetical protein
MLIIYIKNGEKRGKGKREKERERERERLYLVSNATSARLYSNGRVKERERKR